VLRGPAAISYDGQGGVTVFSVPYLLAMVLLGLAGVILWWDLMTRSRSVRRTPGAHVRV
jgi:cytochrome b subunit of formate dehydrogenase